jgi:hypothetical protein
MDERTPETQAQNARRLQEAPWMNWRELPLFLRVCIVITACGLLLQAVAAIISLGKALL